MRGVIYKALPFVKEEATLALESGASGLIVPGDKAAAAASLARCAVYPESGVAFIALANREDEARAARAVADGFLVALAGGWEVIPVENLLARTGNNPKGTLALEVATPEEARLAAGILEKGASAVVVPPEAVAKTAAITAAFVSASAALELAEAEITEITRVGMGHRVCVDTLSRLAAGQGMLVGNSAAFTFLVNAETEKNEYVASRPFRINAGAVHAYAVMPEDGTRYLDELRAGDTALIVNHLGETETAVIGRVKVERRPMLLIRARLRDGTEGAVFLQNAETIRLVKPGGSPASVVSLQPGDAVLCRRDDAGRHFGVRITEDITEA